MKEWHNFPLFEARPEDIPEFARSERSALEWIVAQQVSDLMAAFGKIEVIPVDFASCPGVDESKSFRQISLSPILLTDNSTLEIDQIPEYGTSFVTEPGVHRVSREFCMPDPEDDDEDVVDPIVELIIYDPAYKKPRRRVHDLRGRKASMPVLQELYEALTVITSEYANAHEPNNPSLIAAEFPVPVSDPDFETIIANLG